MELKIYNRIILAVSMVLLCSCVFIICYSIKFNGVKIEFDGISDWISSLSTFGTLVVAYSAYKKAPEWLNQRMHEDAFFLAKKLMLDDYPLLKRKVDKAGALVSYNDAQLDMIGDDFKLFMSVDDCDKALSVFHDLQYTPSQIKINLESLSKLGGSIRSEILIINEKMDAHYKAMNKAYVMAYTAIRTIVANPEGEYRAIYSKSIESSFKKFAKHEEQFDLLYDEIRKMHKKIPDYFNIEKM
ncbi:hypothetical protein [Klebsiella quasipneumoniae]|uniref:hypothetical protein n=1 Tax=Klebsiella quasipneumoniae TaxID=1463165 RepID=UPI003D321F65